MFAQMDNNNLLLQMIRDDDDDSESSDDENMDDDGGEAGTISINIHDWKTLGDPTFKEHFRMDREMFELLLVAVGNHLENNNRIVRTSRRGLDYSLMMVLWILASPDPFRCVGVKFGVPKQEVHFHYRYIIEALREMAPSYVRWPNAYEKEAIAGSFEDKYSYPSVIGCIDGCLIRMTAPLEQPDQYVDWHRQYSITLQAVCDHRLLFRDVYVGDPGSVGDKRTLKRSPLGRNILQNPDIMSDKHLLGDGGYTLTSKILIPYPDNGNLNRRMRTHNYYLSRCRASVERAFALLKGKWRRLKYMHSYCVEYVVDHIMACVVLHNFIILRGRKYEDENINAWADVPLGMNYRQLLQQAKADGAIKRDMIADMLHPE